MFQSIGRSLFASLACSLFLSAVAGAQNPKPALGQVVRSSLASLGGIPVPSGGTVVSGDTLTTAKGGGALVKFSATSQIEVSEDTNVTLAGTPSHLLVTLTQGAVEASVQSPDDLEVETTQCRVQPAGSTGAAYSVSLAPGGSGSVTARHGRVSVVENATSTRRLLAEGQSAACPAPVPVAPQEEGTPAPSQSAGQAAPAPAAHGGSHTALLLLLVGGGAAAGIAAAAAGGHGGGGGGPASPSAP
jgi:FecR protein